MKKMSKKSILWIVVAAVILISAAVVAVTLFRNSSEPPIQECTVHAINLFGNLELDITSDEFLKTYQYADILTVTVNGHCYDVPVCSEYTDVVPLQYLILAKGSDYVVLATNYGQIAVECGVGRYDGATDSYLFADAIAQPVPVTIVLKESGGYLDEWELHRLDMSTERTDYPELTDAEFTNFRMIETTGIGPNRLYRSSSPLDSAQKRDTYAMAFMEQANIQTVINLSDSEEDLKAYDGYAGSYYASCQVLSEALSVNYKGAPFQSDLANVCVFMADHDGPYLIHCKLGKDRTGVLCAILECLMGASSEEVISDYMLTYYNFYGIEQSQDGYIRLAEENIVATLNYIFDLSENGQSILDNGVDLAAAAETYLLTQLGLAPEQIAQLKENLA